jgi:hypothetical protein
VRASAQGIEQAVERFVRQFGPVLLTVIRIWSARPSRLIRIGAVFACFAALVVRL